jgi:hypothetical protein
VQPTFLAIRPLRDGEWVMIKMQSAMASAALAWGLVVVLAPLWLWWRCDTTTLRMWWEFFTVITPTPTRVVIVVLAPVAAILSTWGFMVADFGLVTWGHSWVFYLCLAMRVVMLLTFPPCAEWLGHHPDVFGRLPLIAPTLGWILALAVVIKVWTAAWVWSRTIRDDLLTSAVIGRFLAAWCGTVALAIVLVSVFFSEVLWVRYLLFLVTILVIPLTGPGMAVLAMRFSRHR